MLAVSITDPVWKAPLIYETRRNRLCTLAHEKMVQINLSASQMPSYLLSNILVISKSYTGDEVKKVYKYEKRFHLLCKIILFLGNEYGYLGSKTAICMLGSCSNTASL
jgi:hypothetical protein